MINLFSSMHFLAKIFSHHYNLQALEGTLCVCRGIEIERPVNSSLWFIIVRFENRLTWTLLSHWSFCRTWEHHPPKGRPMVPLYKSQEGSSVARYPSVLWTTQPVRLLDQPSEQDAEKEVNLITTNLVTSLRKLVLTIWAWTPARVPSMPEPPPGSPKLFE